MRIPRGHAGWSLTEVVVVVALLGLIGGRVMSAILNQQRFQRETGEILYMRQGVSDAMEVLSTDIRGSSAADTLRLRADSALELFATIGVSVACRQLSPTVIVMAGESANGNTLTSLLLTPDTGDLALMFRQPADDPDGYWERHRIASVMPTASGVGCLGDRKDPSEGFVLTVQEPVGAAVKPGAAVRFVRRGRYSLYRSSDLKWYLGYRRCNSLGASVCGAIQPITGPFRRYSVDEAQTGFLFEYFGVSGEKLEAGESSASVARVDITARTEERLRGTAGMPGSSPASGTGSIALRNR